MKKKIKATNPIRLCKTLIVFFLGFHLSLIALNNLVDYNSNFEFVKHVLSMDDTFPNNKLKWRSIENSTLHHIGYLIIILSELFTGLLCIYGSFRMWKFRNSENSQFKEELRYANFGLLLGFSLFFVGFITIGGEWFLMWQSGTWNGVDAAFRNAVVFFLGLIFLNQNS